MTDEPEISANEIDRIMNLDPLNLSDADLDKIILYERIARAKIELGVKPKKEVAKIDIGKILASLAPAAPEKPTIKRRF
jgi:hypothetical protein